MSRFYTGILVILFTTLLTGFATSDCQGQGEFTLRAGTVEVGANGSVSVPVFLDVNTPTVNATTASFGVTFRSFLNLTDLTPGITAGSALTDLYPGGLDPSQFIVDLAPTGAPTSFNGATIQMTIPTISSNSNGFSLAAGSHEIAVLNFAETSDKPTTFSPIEFSNALSSNNIPVGLEITDDNSPVPGSYYDTGAFPGVITESGIVEVVTPMVTDFICEIPDFCDCMAMLSWANGNGHAYTEVRIYSGSVGGTLIATLADNGSGVPTTFSIAQFLPTTYFIVGTTNSLDSLAAQCLNDGGVSCEIKQNPTGHQFSRPGTTDRRQLTCTLCIGFFRR